MLGRMKNRESHSQLQLINMYSSVASSISKKKGAPHAVCDPPTKIHNQQKNT